MFSNKKSYKTAKNPKRKLLYLNKKKLLFTTEKHFKCKLHLSIFPTNVPNSKSSFLPANNSALNFTYN